LLELLTCRACRDELSSLPAECAKSARAACFVRYKEKKQNRKSGKIRYEMRKLNAEKRPRIRVRPSTLGVTQTLN
jgi:CCT motif